MKVALFITSLFLFVSAAQASDFDGRLNCRSVKMTGTDEVDFNPTMTLKAESIFSLGDGVRMSNPVVTIQQEGEQPETGRAQYLDNDSSYQGRRYADSIRFDLSKMVSTVDFGRYRPVDTCQVLVMIPKNAPDKGRFSAPVLFHCDQNGGLMIMACELEAN